MDWYRITGDLLLVIKSCVLVFVICGLVVVTSVIRQNRYYSGENKHIT